MTGEFNDLLSVTVRRARRLGDRPVPRLSLYVTDEMDPATHCTDTDADLAASERIFQGDASEIADALFRCLPGGTIDQLIVEFLQRRASMLRVPFTQENKSDGD